MGRRTWWQLAFVRRAKKNALRRNGVETRLPNHPRCSGLHEWSNTTEDGKNHNDSGVDQWRTGCKGRAELSAG